MKTALSAIALATALTLAPFIGGALPWRTIPLNGKSMVVSVRMTARPSLTRASLR